MMHTLPKKLPGDWLAAFKLPSQDGMYERFIVIHPGTGYDKFVVHTAGYVDEGDEKGWSYSFGDYRYTLEQAQIAWLARIKSYIPTPSEVA